MNQDQHSTPLPTRAEAEETESLLTPSGVYSAVDVKIPASDTQEVLNLHNLVFNMFRINILTRKLTNFDFWNFCDFELDSNTRESTM